MDRSNNGVSSLILYLGHETIVEDNWKRALSGEVEASGLPLRGLGLWAPMLFGFLATVLKYLFLLPVMFSAISNKNIWL